MPITPRAEELLSYMTGLAPVGEPFALSRKTVCADLGFRSHSNLSNRLRELKTIRAVREVDVGLWIVQRRPEALA